MTPQLTVNPVMTDNATYDVWSKFTTGAVEEIVITTEQFTLTVPRAQIVSMGVEDADGIFRTPLTFNCLRPTASGSYNFAPWTMLCKF